MAEENPFVNEMQISANYAYLLRLHVPGMPLEEWLCRCSTMLLLWLKKATGAQYGMHFFWNRIDWHNEIEWEWSYLLPTEEEQLRCELNIDAVTDRRVEPLEYIRKEPNPVHEDDERRQKLRSLLERGQREAQAEQAEILPKDLLDLLLEDMDINIPSSEKASIISFSIASGYRLGWFVLWNPEDENLPDLRHNTVFQPLVLAQQAVLSLLKSQYSIKKSTYLPAYHNRQAKSVAILFADIRNFTPLTEMLRLEDAMRKAQKGFVQKLLHRYHDRMTEIVEDEDRGGRIDQFMGDGLMALFGEYELGRSYEFYRRVVSQAVLTAFEMLRAFDELKEEWKNEDLRIHTFRQRRNEDIEINLGIGINFGEVVFDHFGPPDHREYCAVGDHVNFAQRLESEAFRWDEDLGKMRPPILLSQTAREYLKYSEGDESSLIDDEATPLRLHFKGKGHPHVVWGLPRKLSADTVNTLTTWV